VLSPFELGDEEDFAAVADRLVIRGFVERAFGKLVHVILDNYGSHKHRKVRAWLDRHPRFVFPYSPKSASWLNAVEGFFAKLTK
jgi:transposase